MATFYLVRHGHNEWLGKGLAGRLPNVHLSEQGRAEAERVAQALQNAGIDRVISSPLERARETAEPLARLIGRPIETEADIHEVNFGDWNGMLLNDLAPLPEWKQWNTYRTGTRIPNGETILEVQSRMVSALERWRRAEPQGTFALFSHGDPIRAALVYYLGMPLDFLTRLEVSPGSYNILRLEDWGPQVLTINTLP